MTSTLSDPTIKQPTFVAPDVGPDGESLIFELMVEDQKGLKATDSVKVDVFLPPKADAGSDQTVEEGIEVTLNGSNSSTPDGGSLSYQWTKIDGPDVILSDPTIKQPTFVVLDEATFVFKLTVTNKYGLTNTDTCIVDVVKPVALKEPEQAEDVLYAAYAGIGYMSAVSSKDDDEALYNVMLDDLNSLPMILVLDTIFGDPLWLVKLMKLIPPLNPVTFSYQYKDSNNTVLYHSALDITPSRGPKGSGLFAFTGVLSVDFNLAGYQHPWGGECTYYGDDGSYDLVVTVTGYYKATLLEGLEEFFFKSVDIVAKKGLVASYPFGDVAYDGWEILYDVYYGTKDPEYQQGDPLTPVNVKLVPDIFGFVQGDVDFRDYTLGGSFSVDTDTYTFGHGFHYTKQERGSPPQEEVFVEGTLGVPGMDGSVSIYIPDPVENNTIIRISNGIWTSGKMSITSANSVDVEFNNGTANFSGDLGSWTVPNWQDDLDPIGGP